MKYYYPCNPNRIYIESPHFKMLEDDPAWIGEVKKNGWRCLAMRNEKLTLMTKRKTVIKDQLPCLRAELLRMIPENTIVDGELLEKRTKEVKELFYVFDLILYRNVPVWKYPWNQRRMLLEAIITPMNGLIELSDPVFSNKRDLYYRNIDRPDVEGIVMKKANSEYRVGLHDCPDNPFWLKVKRPEACQYA